MRRKNYLMSGLGAFSISYGLELYSFARCERVEEKKNFTVHLHAEQLDHNAVPKPMMYGTSSLPGFMVSGGSNNA
ncbi:MAG: hypothetical protein HYR77_01580 [Ignavibacteria bacterium]|nr:hypothetical protein [Ignavibacteria bacterium]